MQQQMSVCMSLHTHTHTHTHTTCVCVCVCVYVCVCMMCVWVSVYACVHLFDMCLAFRVMLSGMTNVDTITSKKFEFGAPHQRPTSFLTRNTCYSLLFLMESHSFRLILPYCGCDFYCSHSLCQVHSLTLKILVV